MSLKDKIDQYLKTDPSYGQDLMTAFYIIGPEELERILLEAEKIGKRLQLTYPIPLDVGPSEPSGVKIV